VNRPLAFTIAITLGCGSEPGRTAQQAPPAGALPEAAASPAAADTARAGTIDPRDRGAIQIVLSSDGAALGEFIATLLLRDPRGRRTGFDAASGDALQEIPRAWYDDEVIEDPEEEGSGAATRGIEITAPEPGTYTLTVTGTAGGTYDLSLRGYNTRLEPSGRQFADVAIGAGNVHTYIITFAPDSGLTVASPVRSVRD
jgi:hypothetical protein